MNRSQMINILGDKYLKSNIENEEYSYKKAFKEAGLTFTPIKDRKGRRTYTNVDIRFTHENVSVLIETKQNFNTDLASAKEQLEAYSQYEKDLTGNKIVAILANTTNDDIMVWRGAITDDDFLPDESILKTFEEYSDLYTSKVNNKEEVMRNTYELNNMLHRYGISEKLRSQFVGTCLLALKNGLVYDNSSMTNELIRTSIRSTLEKLLNNNLDKAGKLSILNNKVLNSQDIRVLSDNGFRDILKFIEVKILPFINEKTTAGQDLLNLFFITFNKYVGKADKNQAFTPDHITDFMAKITSINKKTTVLDPCCGSGSFLVRAMTQALDNCVTKKEQDKVKKNNIYGIEFDETAYGLSTTNMLIHGDGNSNIYQGSCFDMEELIKEANPDVILMNPPYNAQRKHFHNKYTKTWGSKKKEDPSKGLYFVKYIADIINSMDRKATLAVLLPVACAIGNKAEIREIKEHLLKENTLDAVFTLPNEVFYPGANVTACCMIFKVGTPHKDKMNLPTFFGYYRDDGFRKKKNLGRIEQVDENGSSVWQIIENNWIDLYKNRTQKDGLSAVHEVNYSDEWLCEAYMRTDYSKINNEMFQQTVNDYLAFLVKAGEVYED